MIHKIQKVYNCVFNNSKQKDNHTLTGKYNCSKINKNESFQSILEQEILKLGGKI